MSVTAIIVLTFKLSIALGIFALGLKASFSEATFLFGRPGRLLNAVVSMYVAMPLLAVAVALVFELPPAVEIALVALSISPIPPILPKKALKAGGRESYAIGLLVVGSLLSIVLVPLWMEVFRVVFGMPLQMTSRSVAVVVLTSVLAPLAVGMVVRVVAPNLAERAAVPVAVLASVLLIASVLPVLIVYGRELLSLMGGGTFAALAAFAIIGLLIGHLLGGPRFEDREVLALYTSARHPGVAIAIAQANFPQQSGELMTIVLALLVATIVAVPYVSWVKRHKPAEPAAAGLGQ